VIPGPLKTGDQFANTYVFVQYPTGGLKRDQQYYLYIANKDWNGEDHGSAEDFYCFVRFQTY
jgi:hypothetical protein